MALPSYPTNNTSDIIAIYDNDYNQLFPNVIAMKAQIKETSKAMVHPLETGEEATDHIITNPVEIDLDIFLPSAFYKDTYNSIKQIYTENKLLIVQTRVTTFKNLIITDMPHQEDAKMIDSIIINLKFKEVLFVESQFGSLPISPKKPSSKSTVDRGSINGKTPSTRNESAGHGITGKIT
jgi:hypothetical protein